MKIEQMEYVVEIAKAGSISEAANKFFLTPSSLSQSIKSLEDELGATLFVRTNKGVALTAFGKEFSSYASAILMQIEQLTHRMAQHPSNVMRLAVANTGFRFVSDAIAKLYSRYKNVGIDIMIQDELGYSVMDCIYDHICEIGVMRIWSAHKRAIKKQLQIKQLQFSPLCKVPVYICVGRGNPLFHTERNSVSRKELEPFAHLIYPHLDSGVDSTITDLLHLPASSKKIVVTSRASNYELLDLTDAYCYFASPRFVYHNKNDYSSTRLLLLEDCDITAEIGWIKSEQHVLSPLANELIQIINDLFADSL